jgi:hypothetical protein
MNDFFHVFAKKSQALVFLFLLLSACANVDENLDTEGIALSVTSVSVKTDASESLRSVTDLTQGHIGVFLSGTGYTAQTNKDYSFSSGWSSADPIQLGSSAAQICAYYPYEYTPAITEASSVWLTSQCYSTSEDLCYGANQTKTSANPDIAFTMVRAYAKMTFTITHEATYSGACAVSEIKIAHAGIRASNTLDITNGTPGSVAASGSVSMDPAISSISPGSSATAVVLMVPTTTTLSGDMTFLFTVDGKTWTAKLPVSSNSLSSLVAGNHYKINVHLSESGFSLAMGGVAGTGSMNMAAIAPSNCYIIAPSDRLTIPVNMKGNGNANAMAGTGLSVTHTAASIGVLWQTSPGLVTCSNFDAVSQTADIVANTSGISGNAVVAVYSGASQSGEILWSWHIWVTNYDPNVPSNGNTYTYNSRTWMDRNLGATTTTVATLTTTGLLYQWGRKDPFPGVNVLYNDPDNEYNSIPIYNASGTELTEGAQTGGTGIQSFATAAANNLSNSILHPMWFYYGTFLTNIGNDWYTATDTRLSQNDALWGGASLVTPTAKTIFDPCPAGWRVPACSGSLSPWSGFETINSSGTADTYNEYLNFPWQNAVWENGYGRIYNLASNTYYQATGSRGGESGGFYNVGQYGRYWSASIGTTKPAYATALNFYNLGVDVTSPLYRAHGHSIRCVKE